MLALLDALPASVALWDRDVRLRYGNRRSLQRFGRPFDDLIGTHLSDVVQAHAVELSRPYIAGALAGQVQQVERAMIDKDGQRYNAHQVTHVPNVIDGVVSGYCALAVDMTASLEGYDLARRVRERAALRAEHDRVAAQLGSQGVRDQLSSALVRLDEALLRASDEIPSLRTAVDAIDRSIAELRSTVPARLLGERQPDGLLVAFPRMSSVTDIWPGGAPPEGVRWPRHLTGLGWTAADVRALLDLLPAALLVWDEAFDRVLANRAAGHWLGEVDEAVNGVFDADYAREALLGEAQAFERTVSTAGPPRHLQVCYVPRHRAYGLGVYVLVVDVTARVEAEVALQEARAELTGARERARIADELHNQVIQRLFAAGLSAVTPDAADAQLRSVQAGIVAALTDLETALTTLHESVELIDLLPELARAVYLSTEPYGITAAIENVGSIEYIPPAVAVELLAVLDAALANVVQHARAAHVVVTVAAGESGVWLRVVDDGRGITDGHALGAGMAAMAMRAERLGGTCTWRPSSPRGTIVDWQVPAISAVP
jgi:signal transduction histidine kinase